LGFYSLRSSILCLNLNQLFPSLQSRLAAVWLNGRRLPAGDFG
jgi:hypothetical protein